MPELPEVETLRRQIDPLVTRRKILEVLRGKERRFSSARLSEGRLVLRLRRRGKYLIFELQGGEDLVVHLGMTGQLLWGGHHPPIGDHVHLGLRFVTGMLWLRDPRRFGRALVVERGEYSALPTLANLGPEPGASENSAARTIEFLGPQGSPVKTRLLEQGLVAGVGNYVADEALWRAGVNPWARGLGNDQCRAVREALLATFEESVAAGGVSERDYVHLDGSRGGFAEKLAVHGRAGKPCRRCGTLLSKGRVAGRGTVWCTVCQPLVPA